MTNNSNERFLDVQVGYALHSMGLVPEGTTPTFVGNLVLEALESRGVRVFLQEDALLEQLGDGLHYRCYPMTQDEAEALGRDTRFDSSQVKRPTDYPAWPVITCLESEVCVGDLLVVPSDDGDRVHVVTSIRTDWPANGNIATGAAHIIKWDGDSVRYEPGERARIVASLATQVRVGWSPNSGAMRFSLDDPSTTGI